MPTFRLLKLVLLLITFSSTMLCFLFSAPRCFSSTAGHTLSGDNNPTLKDTNYNFNIYITVTTGQDHVILSNQPKQLLNGPLINFVYSLLLSRFIDTAHNVSNFIPIAHSL